jgi:hypothetical protein
LNSTETGQIRKFGLAAFIFFGFLCALGTWLEKPLPTYLFGALSAFGLGFILFPHQLRPVFMAWHKTAHFPGRVVTTLILTLAYYLGSSSIWCFNRFYRKQCYCTIYLCPVLTNSNESSAI